MIMHNVDMIKYIYPDTRGNWYSLFKSSFWCTFVLLFGRSRCVYLPFLVFYFHPGYPPGAPEKIV